MEDYKEKYEKALERCREFYLKLGNAQLKKEVEEIFPELKEGEDEKIRKELLYYIKQEKNYIESQVKPENSPKLRFLIDAIAWLEKQGEHANFRNKIQIGDEVTRNEDGVLVNLSQLNRVAKPAEKQGEQKPTDKIEPKFKVGDWIIHNTNPDLIYYVKSILSPQSNCYCLEYNGGTRLMDFSEDNDYHLWTIQDAKDGDVLVTKNFIFIFENIDTDNGVRYYCHYEISNDEEDDLFEVAFHQNVMGRVGNGFSYYSPATEEQRNLLFTKMKEAGYEWDAEKKELKKIKQEQTELPNLQMGMKDF